MDDSRNPNPVKMDPPAFTRRCGAPCYEIEDERDLQTALEEAGPAGELDRPFPEPEAICWVEPEAFEAAYTWFIS